MGERLFLVESDPTGLRSALVEGRRLQAIEIDRPSKAISVGAVLSVKVVRHVLGMGTIVAAPDKSELLLEIGQAKCQPASGEPLKVQIARQPRGTKLGIASRSVALAGRGAVHLPLESGVTISRRLEIDSDRRAALEALVADRPGGWIFRRTSGEIVPDDLAAEIATLAAEGRALPATGPDAFRRMANDYAAPDRILAAGLGAQRTVERWCAAFAPSLVGRVEQAPAGLFDLYDLDSAIAALAEPRVALPGGGSLVIEPTEAMTVIDVNAGAESNMVSANLAAVAEIARQLRLRHIGGIVVIDFISMSKPRDRKRIVDALNVAVAQDPAQIYIVPMSPLGLVEMTRARRGPGLQLDTP